MVIRVMVVDDSALIRGLISRALEADSEIEIVASAANGASAVGTVQQARPDIIILDIEMPEMDGMTALPKLLALSPKSKVIMASTLTLRNAAISLEALSLGAADYLAKPSARDSENLPAFYRELIAKIKALAGQRQYTLPGASAAAQAPSAQAPKSSKVVGVSAMQAPLPVHLVRALAIASSTGGPQALQTIFSALPGQLLHIPIFITQHMPPTFTTLLAEHLTKTSGRPSKEAEDGEVVAPGRIYLAPGNFHMLAEKKSGNVALRLTQDAQENFCRPAADPMLRSLSPIYGQGLLTLVLTGMGQDGLEGAKIAANMGGTVIAQDEETCVVYGMPRAVIENKVCRAILPLKEMAPYLIRACTHAAR